MIRTSRQLKALVRNRSNGDSTKAQIIIRNYVMERFLERLSLSIYREKLILKGGLLVSAIVGIENRSTMDIDATVVNFPLSLNDAKKIVEEVITVRIDDGMSFEILSVDSIMDDSDYSGIRVILNSMIETMQTPLKIDFSTGDVITPRDIEFSFKLLFEERTISLQAYNLETVLAEKLETLLSRGIANTRMRDFYDIYCIEGTQMDRIDTDVLNKAFHSTSKNRGSFQTINDVHLIFGEIENSPEIKALWKNYQRKFDFAAGVNWDQIVEATSRLLRIIKPK
ncbi:MAG: nucleotidyl transferase AbiEii/AbiGii toxin family protein [Bacillota bacterium]|nr:nucleotidyl transferase AbiEii/AbiGii toxin family protein [Bacillota bacterium]